MDKMTIDEAIKHTREVAKDKRADADWKWRHGRLNSDDCISCAEEHEQLAKWLQELKAYKDAEEQGLLLRLPCKIGDRVYSITRDFISEYTICSIEKYNEGFFFNWRCEKGIYIKLRGFTNYDIGKTVFLTKEEAEQALAEMKEGSE